MRSLNVFVLIVVTFGLQPVVMAQENEVETSSRDAKKRVVPAIKAGLTRSKGSVSQAGSSNGSGTKSDRSSTTISYVPAGTLRV